MSLPLKQVKKTKKIDLASLYGKTLVVVDVSAVMRSHYTPLEPSHAFKEEEGQYFLTDNTLDTNGNPNFKKDANGNLIPYVRPAYLKYKKILSYEVNGKVVNTSALYGLLRLFTTFSATDVSFVFCFDNVHNLRKDKDSGYKKGRAKVSDDYIEQVDIAKELLESVGYLVHDVYGYEGDDLVVETVRRNKDAFDHVIVVSNDYDLSQTVDDNVYFKNVISSRDDITKENFEEKLKCPYNTILLYKSLVGDTSDKIKGVKGFGPKRFEKFLKEEDILNVTSIMRKNNIERAMINKAKTLSDEEKEEALKCLWLVSPKVPKNYDNYSPKKVINPELLKMFLEEYGMSSIIKSLKL